MKKPAEVFHVGEYLQEEMDERGWTVEDVAKRMGGDDIRVDMLTLELLLSAHEMDWNEIGGGYYLGETEAHQLGVAFGVSPQLFLNIDKTRREGKAKNGH